MDDGGKDEREFDSQWTFTYIYKACGGRETPRLLLHAVTKKASRRKLEFKIIENRQLFFWEHYELFE